MLEFLATHPLDCRCFGCEPERAVQAGLLVGRGHSPSEEVRRRVSESHQALPPFSAEHIANMRGPKTLEHRDNLSAAQKRHFEDPAARVKTAEATARVLASNAHWKRKGPTSLERKLNALLTGAGYMFEEQVRFGRYVVDAWLPEERLAFEADGYPWHMWLEQRHPGYHARRDVYLLDRGVLAVVHLTGDDLEAVSDA